jgi:restriction endonuclease Mrr
MLGDMTGMLTVQRQRDYARALDAADRFAVGNISPAEAERLVSDAFAFSGSYRVLKDSARAGDSGFDLVVSAQDRANVPEVWIGVEIKATSDPIGLQNVNKILESLRSAQAKSMASVSRVVLISRAGFTPLVLQRSAELLGVVDLVSGAELRQWLETSLRMVTEQPKYQTVDIIVRTMMQQIARVVANDPSELFTMEWRQLEAMLREVFAGLGFETRLTPPSNDGGFDLEITVASEDAFRRYLIEVKHWQKQKVGNNVAKHFVGVIVREQASGGLLLGTSGFSETVGEGIVEVAGANVRIGAANTIVSLCKRYARIGSPLWTPLDDITDVFAEKTQPLVRPGHRRSAIIP